MGYSLSWVGLKGGELKALYSLFGLRSIGVKEHIHGSDIGGIRVPAGWVLIYFKHKVIEDGLLQHLSHSGEVVHCFVEDHRGFSSSSGWKNGHQVWQVTHDIKKGVCHLEVEGDPPASLADIRANLLARQNGQVESGLDEDWMIEIPIELSKLVTGFHHDEDIPGWPDSFVEELRFVNYEPSVEGRFGLQVVGRRES